MLSLNCVPISIELLKVNDESIDRSHNICLGLKIVWPDNTKVILKSELLRNMCPCSLCSKGVNKVNSIDKFHAKLTIVQNEIHDQISLREIWKIGRYAIGIRWGDNHDSGIYSYEYLKKLSDESNPTKSDKSESDSCDNRHCKNSNSHGHCNNRCKSL